MLNESRPSTPLSYPSALALWQANQDRLRIDQERKASKHSTTSHQVSKLQRLLAIARAKEWAAKVYGPSHNLATDQEDLDSPIPDNSCLHPTAKHEDIKFHCHKAIESIGLDTHPSQVPLDHPIIQREYILLLLRFNSSSLPTKTVFGKFIQTYLCHLKLATEQVDGLLREVTAEYL
jgi:hypothetical protein